MEIKRKTRKYVKALYELKYHVERRKLQLENLATIANAMHESNTIDDVLKAAENLQKPLVMKMNQKQAHIKNKIQKGDTHRISLQLFKKGNSMMEIAKQRDLALSTIEGHLAGFITTGEIDVLDLMDEMKLEKILRTIEHHPTLSPSELKQQLGADCSYGQIRAAMNYKIYRRENQGL